MGLPSELSSVFRSMSFVSVTVEMNYLYIVYYSANVSQTRFEELSIVSQALLRTRYRGSVESCPLRFTRFDDCEHDHSLISGVLLYLFEYVPEIVPVVLMVPSYSILKLLSTWLSGTPTIEGMSNTHTENWFHIVSVAVVVLRTWLRSTAVILLLET